MFVREKTARGHRYLYLVESVRDGGRVRQQIVRALGRKDVLLASGELDRLVASLARHSERATILSEMDAGRLSCTRIGGPLLFGRLWERLGIADVLADLLRGRGFDFAVERAVVVAVLHRLFVSGSDRACEKGMADYAIPSSEGLQLHHFYRAMAWLGEETAPIAARLSGIPCKDRCYHAEVKRSSNKMASCALAMLHSRGGIFHSFAARFNTRKRSLSALSSVGKCPLVLTARRSLAFKLSIEFVV